MLKEYTTPGHVDAEGKLHIHNDRLFFGYLQDVFPKTNVTVTISERKTVFSDNLRGYYFGVVLKHAQEAFKDVGYLLTLSQVDGYFRSKFLLTETVNENQEFIEEPRTLKKTKTNPVSQSEFRFYIDRIIQFCAENLEYQIPYPNEVLTTK